MKDVNELFSKYCVGGDKAVARLLHIYIEEAHAVDEWILPESVVMKSGEVADIKAHVTLADRTAAARLLVKNRSVLGEMMCDSMEDNVSDRYGAWPERLYILIDGVIVYQGGIGPFDYKLAEVQTWLETNTSH